MWWYSSICIKGLSKIRLVDIWAEILRQDQQNSEFIKIDLYAIIIFLTLQETQRKTKENSGRKHQKESTKEGRAETKVIERDAEKVRERIGDAQSAGRSEARC
jgi:hypothetical protein